MKLKKMLSMTFGALGCAMLLSLGVFMTSFAADHITTMATTAPLNLRQGPGLDSAVMTVIPEGTSVPVYSMTSGGWYNVQYENMDGYCYYQYLNFEGTEDGTVHDGNVTEMFATAPLNVRTEPNTSATILGSLSIDQGIPIISKHDGWFKVNFNGTDAYCYGEYLNFGAGTQDTAETNTMNKLTTTAPLNVRTQPTTEAPIIGSFAAGESVTVIEVDGDWYKVKYGDTIGYSHSGYFE